MSVTEIGVRGRRKIPVAGGGETQGTRSDIHVHFGGTSRFTNTVLLRFGITPSLPLERRAETNRRDKNTGQVSSPTAGGCANF